jgi:hypothetical protein
MKPPPTERYSCSRSTVSPAISLRHRVRVREVTLRRVVDDVRGDTSKVLLPCHRKLLVGLGGQLVEEERIDRRGLLADDAGERGALVP